MLGRVHCFLEKLANFEGFSKVTVEQNSERNEGTNSVDIKGKRFPGKEISQKMRKPREGS